MNHLPIKHRPSGDLQITMESKKCRHQGPRVMELSEIWQLLGNVSQVLTW